MQGAGRQVGPGRTLVISLVVFCFPSHKYIHNVLVCKFLVVIQCGRRYDLLYIGGHFVYLTLHAGSIEVVCAVIDVILGFCVVK